MKDSMATVATSADLAGIAAALDRLSERLARLEDRVSAVHDLSGQAPAFASMVADTVDGLAARIQASGIDIDARLRSTLTLGEIMTSEPTVNGLSRVLQPQAVAIIGMLGGALVSCFEECMTLPEPRRYSPLKALRLLGDPDVQTGLAFLINVARFFGQEIKVRHAEETARRAAAAHLQAR